MAEADLIIGRLKYGKPTPDDLRDTLLKLSETELIILGDKITAEPAIQREENRNGDNAEMTDLDFLAVFQDCEWGRTLLGAIEREKAQNNEMAHDLTLKDLGL